MPNGYYVILYFILEWIERDLVADEGVAITDGEHKTLEECKMWCDQTIGCNSVSWATQTQRCHLKEKCLTKDEPSKDIPGYKSYYKPCSVSCMRDKHIYMIN